MLPRGYFMFRTLTDQPDNAAIYAASFANPSERVHLLATNANALYAPDGGGKDYLLWQRAGTLLAQEFDAAKLRMRGEPQLIASPVFGALIPGVSSVAASSNGSVVYWAHGFANQLRWFNREGKPLKELGEPGEYLTLRLSPDGSAAGSPRPVSPQPSLGVTFSVSPLDLARLVDGPCRGAVHRARLRCARRRHHSFADA